ncbi:MAG: class I SAM-dependent methyltransferase [bacterium]|nr:class I SAM-dependent methyltransferase [bacterium]
MIKSACHDNQAEHYDKKLANQTINEYDYIRENYFILHDRVIALLDIKITDKVLDIGIGTGLLEEKIDKRCTIAGIDISKKMLEKVKQKSLSVELKEGSFLNIPYPDNHFNSVITCFAFHHLSDDEKILALKEIDRVLTPDGKLIIGDFMYKDPTSKIAIEKRFKEEERPDMIEEMGDENFTNIEWLASVYENNQCKIESEQIATISWIVKVEKEKQHCI